MLGHINNTVLIQYFDLGKMRYFEDILGKNFTQKGFSAVIVNINCDFFAPAFIDDDLEVRTATVAMGDKSLTLEQRIVDSKTGEVKCASRTVMAGFDPVGLKSAPIGDKFTSAIAAFEANGSN